jgi:hypothetical protein
VGHIGTLAGRVSEVQIEDDYILLGFTSGTSLTSAVVLLGSAFDELMNSGEDPVAKYNGQWVQATGPIQTMEIAGQQQPIAEIETLNDIIISDRTDVTAAISGQTVQKPSEQEKKTYTRAAPPSKKSSKFDFGSDKPFGSIDDM